MRNINPVESALHERASCPIAGLRADGVLGILQLNLCGGYARRLIPNPPQLLLLRHLLVLLLLRHLLVPAVCPAAAYECQ